MRVVITGIGLLSPIGCNIVDFHEGLRSGRSGIRLIKNFNVDDIPSKIAGQVRNFDPHEFFSGKELKYMDRFSQLGLAAATMACEDGDLLDKGYNHQDTAVYMGTGIGGIVTYEDVFEDLKATGREVKSSAYIIPKIMNNAASSVIAAHHGMKGTNYTINTACSSGGNAIGQAFRDIRDGRNRMILCGGAEAPITRGLLKAWSKMHVLSRYNEHPAEASRPFDKNRDGFVLAEGSAVFILESIESARQRGARIHAEIIGFASNCNADHLTAPALSGQVLAMQAAIEDAGIESEDIDYINAHGTATKMNDKVETETCKEVFGNHAYNIPISSTKSMIGHAMGASSAIEFLAAVLAVKHDFLPPTINFQTPDPDCDLDYVPNQARTQEVNIALSNSFAFGGSNAILVVKKWMSN
ncbi:beta-ketoacyl-ACP synthase II [bacterium]|nr:beta-ketoacyl-ACP synthase II [bacterium]